MVCGSCILVWISLVTGAVLAAIKIYTRLTVGRCTSKRNISGQVAIVTGANVGIGLETVKELLMRNGRVIMACRSLDKGQAALEEAVRETGSKHVTLKQLDLSSLASVRKFADEILVEELKIDLLINNAAVVTNSKQLTEDGLETNFATNHFGPFLLTNLLLPVLQKADNARIVNVSGKGHARVRTFDLDNLNSEKNWDGSHLVYLRTKLANMFFTLELDRRLKLVGIRNISVNALHPGAIKTELARNTRQTWYGNLVIRFIYLFCKTPEEGAQTTVHVAVAKEVEGVSGGFYSDCKQVKIKGLATHAEMARKLWEVSANLVKLQPNESIRSPVNSL